MGPRWPQDGAKAAPRWPLDGPRRRLKATFRPLKGARLIGATLVCCHWLPRRAQEGTREPQQGPKRPPRGPQRSPNTAPTGPKMNTFGTNSGPLTVSKQAGRQAGKQASKQTSPSSGWPGGDARSAKNFCFVQNGPFTKILLSKTVCLWALVCGRRFCGKNHRKARI